MSQSWDAKNYVSHASFVAEYGSPVLALLTPVQGERVLDLGCGDGALTLKIVESGANVYAVDSSESMVKSAKARGLNAEVKNGERLNFDGEFDSVFSNAALHWMLDYKSTIQGVYRSLVTNGRFVGEFGGEGNVQHIVCAMRQVFEENSEFGDFVNPWFFPSAERYKAELENVGFHVEYIESFSRPTPLTSGLGKWLNIFANSIVSNLTDYQRKKFLKEVELLVKPKLYKDQIWEADYVRLRFVARKA